MMPFLLSVIKGVLRMCTVSSFVKVILSHYFQTILLVCFSCPKCITNFFEAKPTSNYLLLPILGKIFGTQLSRQVLKSVHSFISFQYQMEVQGKALEPPP